VHLEVLHDSLLLYVFLVYPIRDRDCVARRPSTSRLYFDVGVDFTGHFFLSDLAAW